MDCGLRGFDQRLEEGVCGFVEDEGEADVHTADAEVVLHHLHLHDILARAWIAHSAEGVDDELRIKGHEE